MSIDSQALAATSQASRGMSTVYEAVAEALLNIPSSTVIADLDRIASAMGDDRFASVEASPDLEQRFYNRFFVSSSAYHIAWSESSVWNSGVVDGRIEYASPVPSRKAHAIACYEKAGFDYHKLTGYEIAVSTLSPDAFASELAHVLSPRWRRPCSRGRRLLVGAGKPPLGKTIPRAASFPLGIAPRRDGGRCGRRLLRTHRRLRRRRRRPRPSTT